MNLINSILGILILIVLITIGYKVSQIVVELNSPISPTINTSEIIIPEQTKPTYLRWNHFLLTVYINDEFVRETNPRYVNDVKQTLNVWESTGLVSFSIVNTTDSDITIKWVLSLEKTIDTLGNTDVKFINVSQFNIIQNATIELLTKSDSRELNSNDMVNLALHEIGHALGLQHTTEDDIMNPILTIPSKTVKNISPDNIKNLQELYRLPVKPDLKITEINVNKSTFTRFGRNYFYLNISVNIQNVGLIDTDNFTLQTITDNTLATEETITKLEPGNILNIFQGNLKIDKNFTSVQVTIDPKNVIDELNETNNFIDMPV